MPSLPPLFERTHIVVGDEGLARLQEANVFLAGVGGVGSFAAEALARMGVGRITQLDHDVVSASNLNRQLPALRSTIGRKKVEVVAERIRDINPECSLTLRDEFLRADDVEEVLADAPYDFVVDAIDSLNSKAGLVAGACTLGYPVASSMGAGGRTDPRRIVVGFLMDSENCALARNMRKRLRKRGIGRGIMAVWSNEPGCPPLPPEPTGEGRDRAVNGTVSYMPGIFGLTLAGAAIQRLLEPKG